jgi:hypothetical protein
VDGGICGREPGHEGAHVDGAQGVALSFGRCGELSPGGVPCALPAHHAVAWGEPHSWERCTSLLLMGFPETRCTLSPRHVGGHTLVWQRLGMYEGIEL